MLIQTLNNRTVALFGLCLFDSGSTSTLINERAIPQIVKPLLGETQQVTTTQGIYESSKFFYAEQISFPEFCKTRYIPKIHLRTFLSPTSRYDFIVGRDVLRHGFILNHARHCVTWDGLTIPISKDARTDDTRLNTVTHFTCTHQSAEIYAAGTLKIKMAKYNKVAPQIVASQCNHLSAQQQLQLGQLLSKFPDIFSGKLGRYNRSKFTLQLQDPTTTPIFCKPYPFPQAHIAVFKQELDHLLDKGVLAPIPCSEWAFPTFIIHKKDGRVRWVSDFRKLNHLLKRPRYFLPSIPHIMQRRKGFRYITKIDINMGFYTFEIDQQSQKFCVISTPFGLF